jgi:hydroxymethylpyrimidine/phosphomethylpyrimidine kinase
LLPHAALVTPNLPEAARLTGLPVEDAAGMERAARAIHAMGARAVLVKGGHLAESAMDLLLADGRVTVFPGERIESTHTHGTGCTLAAAITARLARGDSPVEAVAGARRFVREAIATAPRLGGGCGPVNHFAPIA